MIEVLRIYAFPCSPPCKRALSALYLPIIQNAMAGTNSPFRVVPEKMDKISVPCRYVRFVPLPPTERRIGYAHKNELRVGFKSKTISSKFDVPISFFRIFYSYHTNVYNVEVRTIPIDFGDFGRGHDSRDIIKTESHQTLSLFCCRFFVLRSFGFQPLPNRACIPEQLPGRPFFGDQLFSD